MTTSGFRLPTPEKARPTPSCPAQAYLETLGTDYSRRGMRSVLNQLCALAGMETVWEGRTGKVRRGAPRNLTLVYFPWCELRAGHVVWLMKQAKDAGYAPPTQNRMLSALYGVLVQMRKMGVIDANELEAARDVMRWSPQAAGPATPGQRPISVEEFERMLTARSHDLTEAHRVRNDAILWLLWGCGLRRSELVAWTVKAGTEVRLEGLTLARYDAVARRLTVSLKRRTRYVPVEGPVREALHRWLAVRGSRAGAIFVAVDGQGGVRLEQPIRDHTVWNVVERRAAKASPPVENMTCHRWRHNFVTTLHVQQAVPIGLVSKMVGHASPATTLRYINPDEADMHAAVQRMPMPPRLTLPPVAGEEEKR